MFKRFSGPFVDSSDPMGFDFPVFLLLFSAKDHVEPMPGDWKDEYGCSGIWIDLDCFFFKMHLWISFWRKEWFGSGKHENILDDSDVVFVIHYIKSPVEINCSLQGSFEWNIIFPVHLFLHLSSVQIIADVMCRSVPYVID